MEDAMAEYVLAADVLLVADTVEVDEA